MIISITTCSIRQQQTTEAFTFFPLNPTGCRDKNFGRFGDDTRIIQSSSLFLSSKETVARDTGLELYASLSNSRSTSNAILTTSYKKMTTTMELLLKAMTKK